MSSATRESAECPKKLLDCSNPVSSQLQAGQFANDEGASMVEAEARERRKGDGCTPGNVETPR